MWSFSLRKPPKGQKLADDELVSQESDAFRVLKGRVRKSGQPGVCKAPADGEKGQFGGGFTEIDDQLYSIVGDAVCGGIAECVGVLVAVKIIFELEAGPGQVYQTRKDVG